MPAADKDDVLVRFLSDEGDLLLRAELLQRFREATAPKDQPKTKEPGAGRSANCSRRGMRPDEGETRAKAEQRAREKAREGPEGMPSCGGSNYDYLSRRAARDMEVRRGADRPQDGDEL